MHDEAAARLLFARYAPLLRARARRRLIGGLRRKLGESDLVQETYLSAFQGLDAFEDRGPGSFRRWIEKVMEHKANDQVKRYVRAGKRSARREVSQMSGASDAGPKSPVATPSSQAARNEEQRDLRLAIAEMTGDDRLILELVHEQGLDFAAAGRRMNRSAEAARKLYGRVIVRLGKRMRPAP